MSTDLLTFCRATFSLVCREIRCKIPPQAVLGSYKTTLFSRRFYFVVGRNFNERWIHAKDEGRGKAGSGTMLGMSRTQYGSGGQVPEGELKSACMGSEWVRN